MILEIKNVKKNFGSETVLKDINLTINEGETVAIIGQSGSGKSTLLRSINRLNEINGGDIIFDGTNIKDIDINVLRSKIGMVFQSFNLFNNMNVLKNCMIGQMKVLNKTKEEAEKKSLIELQKVGMINYRNKNVNNLSGGQKQRVAIARSLSMDPKIILFDEPTSALDPEMVDEVLEVIKEIKKTNKTMIVVTHEMQFARDVADRIVFMNNGIILEDQKTEDFFNNPKNERTKEFLRRYINS